MKPSITNEIEGDSSPASSPTRCKSNAGIESRIGLFRECTSNPTSSPSFDHDYLAPTDLKDYNGEPQTAETTSEAAFASQPLTRRD
jgi:hypothetical protein